MKKKKAILSDHGFLAVFQLILAHSFVRFIPTHNNRRTSFSFKGVLILVVLSFTDVVENSASQLRYFGISGGSMFENI
jgi:uncharacterized membrane protein YjfL (UPF0719 family)